jgi:hypothetical protein
MSRFHLTEEEVYDIFSYDIFRAIFANEEDALAATIQLFGGDPVGESWEDGGRRTIKNDWYKDEKSRYVYFSPDAKGSIGKISVGSYP